MATQVIAGMGALERVLKARQSIWWVAPVACGALIALLATVLDEYLLYVATSWVVFGLLGFSLCLVWGKGGFLSLGQTAFYGLGGYVASVAAINFAPLTGNTLIWILPVGAAVGAAVAALVGYFIFFGRLGPIQGTILTYTFTLVLWTGAIGFTIKIGNAVVGGDNGMTGIPELTLTFGEGAGPLAPFGMFVTVVAIAVIVFVTVSALLRTPFGLIVDGVRLNEVKTELLGYDIRFCRLVLFTIAGGIAGIAGSLFAGWATYINPTVFSFTEALLVPIYVLVGGRRSLVSGFVGAVAVGGLSFWLGGGVIGGQTTLALGIILILLVIFLPQGLVGLLATTWQFLVLKLASPRPSAPVPTTADAQVRHGDGGTYTTSAPVADTATGPVLETVALRKAFGGVLAADDISLVFQRRKIFCLIGPNGAGKSTFLHVCMGLHKADSGTVRLEGTDITNWQPFARVRAGLGIKLQVTQIYEDLTIWQNLWLAAYSRTREHQAADEVVEGVLAVIGLGKKRSLPGSQLAHGEQQWLDIGMILCLGPKVILLDEPTAGMTPEETRQTAQLVSELANSASVVVVEHDMEFVRTLDADITVLHHGAIFAQGRIDALRQDDRVLDIYLGRRQSVKGI